MKYLLIILVAVAVMHADARRCFNNNPRSITGQCNNRIRKNFGTTGTTYRRGRMGYEYVDPLDPLSNTDEVARGLPNIRDITTALSKQQVWEDFPNSAGINALSIFFGQFVAHDFSEAEFDLGDAFRNGQDCAGDFACEMAEKGNTATLPGARIYEPSEVALNRTYIPMTNSFFKIKRGVSEPVNVCTHFLDLSQVYGSDDGVAESLRTFEGGLLKSGDYSLVNKFAPPFVPPTQLNNYLPILADVETPTKLADIKIGVNRTQRFGSGDTRTNENIVLASMHGIWFREHNRKAQEIADNNPEMCDEDIYQEARKWTIATYQHIVYDEWLPLILGTQYDLIEEHCEFRDYVAPNPKLSQAFVSAAFRIHTGMINFINPQDQCYNSKVQCAPGTPPQQCLEFFPFAGQQGGPFQVFDQFAIYGGLDAPLRGAYNQAAQEFDLKVTDALRHIPTSRSIVDVLAININRGRLHGVPNYERVQKRVRSLKSIYKYSDCPSENANNDLEDPIECFNHITSDATQAANLKALYKKVNKIDLWIGLYAEDHVAGSPLGKSAATIIAEQFSRTRNGDRFWYENSRQFSVEDLSTIKAIKAADIFNLNSGLTIDNAFATPAPGDLITPASCSA